MRQWLLLTAIVGLLAILWLVVLPHLGSHPSYSQRMERLERQGIDPSALFYTELEFMDDVSRKNKQRTNHEQRKLWVPSW
ncbi:MAG: hypothetical protein ACFCD0_07830 [Gemmataceae bacterium]